MHHAIIRAKERYGLDLTLDDLRAITRRIQTNDGTTFDHIEPSGCTVWWLKYQDVQVKIMMSADFWRVVTFLPLHKRSKRRREKRKIFYRSHGKLRKKWA